MLGLRDLSSEKLTGEIKRDMASLDSLTDYLVLIFFILMLMVFFYGQNWQGWYAGRQLTNSLRLLGIWRDYGISIVHQELTTLVSPTLTNSDIKQFIQKMLEFFVISPSPIDPPLYNKIHFLSAEREKRYRNLIENFISIKSKEKIATITSLLQATTEIDILYKKVNHNLLVGKQTKSYWFLLQSAAEITQIMLNAHAYRAALDSFLLKRPIGDSIGPMVVADFTHSYQENANVTSLDHGYCQSIVNYRERECICLRAKGPECVVGNPGDALEKILSTNPDVKIIITIDAMSKLKGEKTGTVAQGLGVAAGGGNSENSIEKYKIENLAYNHNPIIPVEAIICREALEEAVLPMNEEISESVPKIIRILKEIIRNQTSIHDKVIIIGIGNAIGIPC